MKKSLLKFLSLIMLIPSFGYAADLKCVTTIKAKSYFQSTRGPVTDDREIQSTSENQIVHSSPVQVKDWQSCFNFAVALADKNVTSLQMNIPSLNFNPTALVYVEWNIVGPAGSLVSYFTEESGRVSKYSHQFLEAPQEGDQRFQANGSSY